MPGEVRKTVTVLFADVVGSTATGERLDPEVLRRVMTRYFESARSSIERHGGTVEKFIGDAVMAVFGIPTAHEDDALRAVRAAADLRDAVAELDVDVRIGVNTGEVVAGTGDTLVTGDAVNVAARLEQNAETGTVLLGASTHALVAHAVDAEPIEPIALKGKSEPVPAFLLHRVAAEAPSVQRHLEAPMVGRERELTSLLEEYEAAKGEGACRVVTVLGPAGIGKSRLTAEVRQHIGDEATLLYGRCLSYGEGITYWPLVEMLRAVDVEAAGDVVAERVQPLTGEAGAAASSEEAFWAVRKLFEHLAAERPLVLVVDDIQWAEPTLLDLLESIAVLARGPILLLAQSRPELIETRPSWPGRRLALEPLSAEESEQLIANAGGAFNRDAMERIREAAAGNPLFVEQMVAMLEEDSDVRVPPTIQALLAARLDRLATDERTAIECASVVGHEFWTGAVRELAGGEFPAGRAVLDLVRHEFVTPCDSSLPAEDAFAFRHLLVRDAAYAALPKERRSDAHAHLAGWLDAKDAEREVAFEEISGYHLEQAYRYRLEIVGEDERTNELADAAGERLANAGVRAWRRGDAPAATNLLERAAKLLSETGARARLLVTLGTALLEEVRLPEAQATLAEAAALAREQGLRAAELEARMVELRLVAQSDPSVDMDAVRSETRATLSELELLADDSALAAAWTTQTMIELIVCNYAGVAAAGERAAEYAARNGDARGRSEGRLWMQVALWIGATPAAEALVQCEQLAADASGPQEEAAALGIRGAVKAITGGDGRPDVYRAIALCEEIGLQRVAFGLRFASSSVEIEQGNLAAAERELRLATDALAKLGETAYLSTLAGVLGVLLAKTGRNDEALEWSERAHRLSAPRDVASQVEWRLARARAFSNRGEHDAAEPPAREAVAIVAATDAVGLHADATLDLADVVRASGKIEEATELARDALALYERKGHVVGVRRARALLDELSA